MRRVLEFVAPTSQDVSALSVSTLGRPVTFGLLLAGILGVASMVGSFPFLGFGALWIVFLFLPGSVLTDALVGRGRLPFLERVAIGFCLSLVLIAVPATVAYLLRLGLVAASMLLIGVEAVAVGAALWWRRKATGAAATEMRGGASGLFAIAVGVFAALAYRWAGHPFRDKLGDVWFHLAYIRKLAEGGVATPANPIIRGEGAEFVYGYNVWHFCLALFGRWLGVDTVEVWAYAVPFVSAILLCAVFPLARGLFGAPVAVAASFIYLVGHVVVGRMGSLLTSPNPAAIAIWIVSPVVLALFARYVITGEARFLWLAAGINVLPAVLHFVEPMGVVLALAFLATAAAVRSDDRDHRRRALWAVVVIATVLALAFAVKAPLIQGQGASFSEYAAHRPIHLGGGLIIANPFSTELRDPIQIAALLALPLLFPWLGHLGVQLLVFVPILYFVLQYNPLLATAMSWLTGEVFVRKGISFLRTLNVITLALVLLHYANPLAQALRAGARDARVRESLLVRVVAIGIGISALVGLGVYLLHVYPSLSNLGQTKLSVPDRHALKGFFVGPLAMAVFAGVGALLAAELLRPRLGPALRRVAGHEPGVPSSRTLAALIVVALVVLAVAIPLLERRLTERPGVPFPRDANAVTSSEYRYLRTAAPTPTVVLVKARDGAFDQTTPGLLLQALTPHYAVSLPDPDVKRTRSGVDYARRFRDVKHVYSGDGTIEDVQRVVSEYDVSYVLASRGDSSRPLHELLRAHPERFPLVHEAGDVAIFRVMRPGAAGR